MTTIACRRKVRSHLVELPSLYDNCARALVHRREGLLQRRSGRRLNGICLNDTAVAVRSQIVGVLASWAGLVVDERRVPSPDQRQVVQLAGFLDSHLDWLLAHPAAPDFADEIVSLANAARGVIDRDPLHIELGRCEKSGCGRTMYATISAGAESAAHKISCEAGHAWQPEQWLLLARRMKQVKRGLLHGQADSAGRAI